MARFIVRVGFRSWTETCTCAISKPHSTTCKLHNSTNRTLHTDTQNKKKTWTIFHHL